jgi:hypothetical protein
MPIALTMLFAVDAIAVVAGAKGIVGTLTYTGNDRISKFFNKYK